MQRFDFIEVFFLIIEDCKVRLKSLQTFCRFEKKIYVNFFKKNYFEIYLLDFV